MENISENEKLENLFIAARNARKTSDYATASKLYEEISVMQPNSWEALFYLAVLKTNSIKYGEISNTAIEVTNCLPKVFELINTTIEDEKIKKEAVKEVTNQCIETVAWLIKASEDFYNLITKNTPSFSKMATTVKMDAKKRNARYESAKRMVNIGNILCHCGNCIEETFGLNDRFYKNLAEHCFLQKFFLKI